MKSVIWCKKGVNLSLNVLRVQALYRPKLPSSGLLVSTDDRTILTALIPRHHTHVAAERLGLTQICTLTDGYESNSRESSQEIFQTPKS